MTKTLAHLAFVALAACAPADAETSSEDLTSNSADALDLVFDGEVIAAGDQPARVAILTQLQFLRGLLVNQAAANAQIAFATLSNIVEVKAEEGRRFRYRASVPVLWSKSEAMPETLKVSLPIDNSAYEAFADKYEQTCTKRDSAMTPFWHAFHPNRKGCNLNVRDVHTSLGRVLPSKQVTSGKYPEYDRMLADGRLEVVSLHGFLGDGDRAKDGGLREMEAVVAGVAKSLTNVSQTMLVVPQDADADEEKAVYKASVTRGTAVIRGREVKVQLTAMIASDFSGDDAERDRIYGGASEAADLIIYSGHSGYGSQIGSIERKTRTKANQYQVMFLDGCETFAYLGTSIHHRKRAQNGEARDPNGTRDFDVIANAMPAYSDGGVTILSLYRSMLKQTASYDVLLKGFSPQHLTAVFGEEDNAYRP